MSTNFENVLNTLPAPTQERVNVRLWQPNPLNPRHGAELETDALELRTWNPKPHKSIKLMRIEGSKLYTVLCGHRRLGKMNSLDGGDLLAFVDSSYDGGKRPDSVAVGDDDYGVPVLVYPPLSVAQQLAVMSEDTDVTQLAWTAAQRFRFYRSLLSQGCSDREAARMLGERINGKSAEQFTQWERLSKCPPVVQEAWLRGETDKDAPRVPQQVYYSIAKAVSAYRRAVKTAPVDSYGKEAEKLWSEHVNKTATPTAKAMSFKDIRDAANTLAAIPGADEAARILYAILGYDSTAPRDATGNLPLADAAATVAVIVAEYRAAADETPSTETPSTETPSTEPTSTEPTSTEPTKPHRRRQRNADANADANANADAPANA